MSTLLHDPCCALGLVVVAIGGIGAIAAAIVGKIRGAKAVRSMEGTR